MLDATAGGALVSALAVTTLILVHAFANRLRFIDTIPRSRWLSAGAGVSIAYVFMHILPEFAEGQNTFDEASAPLIAYFERHIYLVATAGLVAFYGLESLALRKRGTGDPKDGQATPVGVFWVHMGSFGFYNFLIGYLMVQRESDTPTTLALYTLAMAIHFVVIDAGLSGHHRHRYLRLGRWLLVTALFIGWLVARMTELPRLALSTLEAFLAGGIILNVMKEELPEERQSRFSAFLLGVAAYAVLLSAM